MITDYLFSEDIEFTKLFITEKQDKILPELPENEMTCFSFFIDLGGFDQPDSNTLAIFERWNNFQVNISYAVLPKYGEFGNGFFLHCICHDNFAKEIFSYYNLIESPMFKGFYKDSAPDWVFNRSGELLHRFSGIPYHDEIGKDLSDYKNL